MAPPDYARSVPRVDAPALFDDPTLQWRGVSPRLLTERRMLLCVVLVAAAAVLGLGVTAHRLTGAPLWPFAAVAGALLAVTALGWFLVVPRQVRSWGYAEADEDLLVRRGRLVRRLTVVPYGRMQVIEVRANPISQRLGIATVELVTASATTDASIPGVEFAAAYELRERLAAKGEASAAGL